MRTPLAADASHALRSSWKDWIDAPGGRVPKLRVGARAMGRRPVVSAVSPAFVPAWRDADRCLGTRARPEVVWVMRRVGVLMKRCAFVCHFSRLPRADRSRCYRIAGFI